MSAVPDHVAADTLGAVSPTAGPPPALQALVVDDERPALAELVWLLGQDPRVGSVRAAASAEEALVALDAGGIDVVFCDIQMPGLDGIAVVREAWRLQPDNASLSADYRCRSAGSEPRWIHR